MAFAVKFVRWYLKVPMLEMWSLVSIEYVMLVGPGPCGSCSLTVASVLGNSAHADENYCLNVRSF